MAGFLFGLCQYFPNGENKNISIHLGKDSLFCSHGNKEPPELILNLFRQSTPFTERVFARQAINVGTCSW